MQLEIVLQPCSPLSVQWIDTMVTTGNSNSGIAGSRSLIRDYDCNTTPDSTYW